MNRNRTFLLAAVLNIAAPSAAFGQMQMPPPPVSTNTIVSPVQSDNPAQGVEDRRMQQFLQSQGNPHQKEAQLEEADATAKTLQLSCQVTDSRLADAGKEWTGKAMVNAKLYEVSCADGMGYFMMSHKPLAPTAFSCFAADGQRAAAAAEGKKFDNVCKLPANNNLGAMATKILSRAGTSCTATKLRWFGQSAVTKSEYVEVGCDDGKGYFLTIALPGSPMQTGVTGCAEAAAHGMTCQYTRVEASSPSAAGVDAKN